MEQLAAKAILYGVGALCALFIMAILSMFVMTAGPGAVVAFLVLILMCVGLIWAVEVLD